MATPAPVIRSAQVSIPAHQAARNVSASPGSGQWITERRAVTRKWRRDLPAKVRRDTGPGRVRAGWIQGGDHRPFPSRFAASSSRMNEARFEYRKPRIA